MARAKKETALTPEERLQAALVPDWEWPYKLPENWCWVKASAVARIYTGNSISEKIKADKYAGQQEGLLFIATKDIGFDNAINYETDIRIPDYPNFKIAPANTALLCIEGGSAGRKVGFVNREVCFGNKLCVFAAKKVNSKFIYYILQSQYFIQQFNNRKHGLIGGVSVNDLAEIGFPLSPLAEQQRIVDRIESLFAKLDEAKEKAQAVVDSFETRKAAILHKAFTGELTAKWRRTHGLSLDTWKEVAADSLFEYVTSGSRGWAKYYDESGAVFIRMGNLDHGTIELDFSDIQHVKLPNKAEGQRSRIRKNDILISITADVGMVGLVRNDDFEGYINQHIALARPVMSESAEFIAWYLVSDIGLKQMQEKQRGATKVGLSLNDIRALQLKIPLIEEQNEILKVIKMWIGKEQQSQEAAEAVLDQIDLMKKSILARAFRGELGTNDPSEESAVELIKQIKQDSLGKISGDTLEKKRVKKKVEVGLVAKSIMQALSAGAKLTPENLKAETALPIDDFYDQLKILINGGHVIETRIDGESYLEAKDEDR